jgi:hypothetical protein
MSSYESECFHFALIPFWISLVSSHYTFDEVSTSLANVAATRSGKTSVASANTLDIFNVGRIGR